MFLESAALRGDLGEAPPTGDTPVGSSGFLKRSAVGVKNDLRLHSEVSQMSTIEILVELQVRGRYEHCIVNIWHNAKADTPFLEKKKFNHLQNGKKVAPFRYKSNKTSFLPKPQNLCFLSTLFSFLDFMPCP